MTSYYSIDVPSHVKDVLNKASAHVVEKTKVDVNNKFMPEKYEFHMTFIYLGQLAKDPRITMHMNEIDELIRKETIDAIFTFKEIDLFGRFVVAKYELCDTNLIKIKEKLLNSVCDILREIVDIHTIKTFAKQNCYDIIDKRFVKTWNPHITIGSIRTPGTDYCARKKISAQECINGSYKDINRYLTPFFQISELTFHATKLINEKL